MHEPITAGEATRRTAGVGALLGLAVVHVTALPYTLVQGRQIAAISVAAIATALALALALACAGAAAGRSAWRLAGALGALTGVGWMLTRAVAVPGVAEDRGQWVTLPGLACVALATALVGLAATGAGVPDVKGALRGAGVSVGLAPAVAIALAAAGPPPAHHNGVAPAHVATAGRPHRQRAAPSGVTATAFRPGFGGHAGRYVYANARRPQLAASWFALALGVSAAALSLAAATLRARRPMGARQARLAARDLASWPSGSGAGPARRQSHVVSDEPA